MKGLRLLLIPAVALLFLGLGASTIWDANEAFYADTPRQMVLSGDYVNPIFNGEARMNKPVLSYWIVAGLYKVFGLSLAVERFGIALGALGILLAAYICGRALRSPLTGWLAVLIVATAPRFVMFSRRIFIDIWVTMFMGLSIGCFLLAETYPERRRLWLGLMYAAIGLGVLTKGPVALVFPAATIGVWLLVERRLRDIRTLWIVPGALIVLAINAPWWGAIYAQHGMEPLQAFWLGENFGRYTEPMQPGERDIWFYVPVVIGDLFPWSIFVMAGLGTGAAALWSRVRNADAAGAEAGAAIPAIKRFLIIWVALLVGVFSFSETKQDLYVFPIIPALAALAADAILTGVNRGGARLRAAFVATAVLLLVGGAGIAMLFGFLAPTHHIAGANALGATLVAGGLVVIVMAFLKRAQAATLALAGTMVVANYIFVLVSLPAVEAFKPVLPMVRTIQERTRPGQPPVVAHYITSLPSLVYYLERPVEGYFDLQPLIERARTVPEMYILMRPHEYADFEPAARAQSIERCIVLRQTLFEAKLKLVLQGRPWPEVYLVGTGAACAPRLPPA
jgi:4-amino-4-deoxy-L-arabinose transferase-like glycosyltransferase